MQAPSCRVGHNARVFGRLSDLQPEFRSRQEVPGARGCRQNDVVRTGREELRLERRSLQAAAREADFQHLDEPRDGAPDTAQAGMVYLVVGGEA